MTWKGQRSKRLWHLFTYTCNVDNFLDWWMNTTQNFSRIGRIRVKFGSATSRIHIRSNSGFVFLKNTLRNNLFYVNLTNEE